MYNLKTIILNPIFLHEHTKLICLRTLKLNKHTKPITC